MRLLTAAATLTVALVLLASPAAGQPLLDVSGAALIDLIEISKNPGEIGHKNDATLKLGDGVDDEVQIIAGAGDSVSIWVNQNVDALFAGASGDIGLGTITPQTPFHIYRFTDSDKPLALFDQDYDTRDASLSFRLNRGTDNRLFSMGIDQSDNQNFKIVTYLENGALPFQSEGDLSGTGAYNDLNTVMRIHSEDKNAMQHPGIVDFNHQSRTRWSLLQAQPIPQATWTPVEFDFDPVFMSPDHFDEHSESIPGQPAIPWNFVATEEGYYQVNARIAFGGPEQGPAPPAQALLSPAGPTNGVSIAIVKTDVAGTIYMHSQGNNLQFFLLILLPPPNEPPFLEVPLEANNAPNVSDVVFLQAGDSISIWAWWDMGLMAGYNSLLEADDPARSYVSVHKIS